MEDDPFALLIPQCQPTSSQEEKFQRCPFAGESKVSSQDELSTSSVSNDTPVEPTGILMVSLPDSANYQSSHHEEEEFHTPPENSHSLQPSSYEDQKVDDGDGRTVAVDDGCMNAQSTVDLGKDSDNLWSSGPVVKPETNGGDCVLGVDCSHGVNEDANEIYVNESRKFGGLYGEFSQPPWKKSRVCTENLGSETPYILVNNNDTVMVKTRQIEIENGDTEILEAEFEEGCVGLADSLTENTQNMNVEMPVREPKEGVVDIEKFKYVGSGGRRELPISMRVQEENVGGDSSSAKNQVLKDLLDALKMVVGKVPDGTEDVDYLETAKRRGLTFPRPRWKTRENLDD